MEAYKTALPVITISLIIGLSAGLFLNMSDLDLKIQSFVDEIENADKSQSESEIGQVGSAHEHASFHVVINGSEKDFTGQKFQLNSRHVHLENNNSDIVHKHATGITWEMFFQTMNLSTSVEKGDLCLEIYENKSCGNGSVVLNNEFNASLNQEISQGDILLIILNTEGWRDVSEEYMQKQIPEEYQTRNRRGTRI